MERLQKLWHMRALLHGAAQKNDPGHVKVNGETVTGIGRQGW